MTDAADGHDYRVVASEPVFDGRVISLRRDTVAMPGGGDSVREVVSHPGAVAVVALDDAGDVVLLRQYRHPVGGYLWELPAGLRDAEGEPPGRTYPTDQENPGGYAYPYYANGAGGPVAHNGI